MGREVNVLFNGTKQVYFEQTVSAIWNLNLCVKL